MGMLESRSSERQEHSDRSGVNKGQDIPTRLNASGPFFSGFPLYKQLTFKLILPLIILLLLSGLVGTWLSLVGHQHIQEKLTFSKANSIVETISAVIRTVKSNADLNKLINEIASSKDIELILIIGGTPSTVQHSSQQHLVGVQVTDLSNRLIPENVKKSLEQQRESSLRQTDNGQLFITMLPDSTDKKAPSVVLLGLTPTATYSELNSAENIAVLTVFILFICGVVFLYIRSTRLLTVPIKELQDRLTNKTPINSAPNQADELGILIQSYEQLVKNNLLSEKHHKQVMDRLDNELTISKKHEEQALRISSILKQRNRKLLENQKVLDIENRANDEFISAKIHNICSHLSNILKPAYDLKDQPLSPEQLDQVSKICNFGNSIYTDVHEIGSFSKIKTSDMARENNKERGTDDELLLGLSKQAVQNIQQDTNDSKRVKVLLVEDYPVNQTVARSMLQKLNCDVELAENGQQALDHVQLQEYDLVLMDCQMPVMDGYEASQQIRALGNKIKQPPIVAATAHALVGDRQRCLDTGMDDFISKPIQLEELSRVVKQWGTATPENSINTDQSSETHTGVDSDTKEQQPIELNTAAILAKEQVSQEVPEENTPVKDEAEAQQIFDRTALSGRLNNDKPLMEAVLEVYIRDSGKLLEHLSLAITEKDKKTASELAHRLKGSSANVGATTLYSLSADIYQASKVPEWSLVADLLTKAQHTFEAFKRVSKEDD